MLKIMTIKINDENLKICMRWWKKIMQQCKYTKIMKKIVIKQLTQNKIFL